MTLPPGVRAVLPRDTARTWTAIAPILPAGLYLAGGTGLAVWLGHRTSRDLDFFFHARSVDLERLAGDLAAAGAFVVTGQGPGTMSGVFSRTKVQFLHADEVAVQRLLEPTSVVAGVRVAGVGDILAMKLKVIRERGELRDYFDLMAIEQQAGRTVDEGLSLYLERYAADPEADAIGQIVRSIGYLDDVDEDRSLPLSKHRIAAYWARRQPEIIRGLSRFD